MPGESVIVKSEIVEGFRKEHVLSRTRLFSELSVHGATGIKLLRGEPVRLSIAHKVADALGVNVQELIKSWE